MAGITPHLVFPGNCEEALQYYQEKFSGKILHIERYKGSPMEAQVSEAHLEKVLHARFQFGDNMIMAADAMPGKEMTYGDNISLALEVPDVKLAETYFNHLAADGTVTFPLQKTFWGATFGSVKDKYQVHWMFNIPD